LLHNSAITCGSYAMVMIALAAVAFGGLVELPFDTDDSDYLRDARASLDSPSQLFASDKHLPGRPVIEILFMVAYSVWGDDPAGYHLLLLGLHLCASLLLAYTLRRLGASHELSFLGGLFFLLNVAHFRAVQWISCAAYPLALILGLTATLLIHRFLEDRARYLPILAAAVLALAVGSHAGSASIAVFCAYRVWRKGNDFRTIGTAAGPLLAVALAGAAFLHFTYPDAPQSTELITVPSLASMVEKPLVLLGRLVTGGNWAPLLPSVALEWEWLVGLSALMALVVLVLRHDGPTADWAVWTLALILPFVNRDTDGLSRHLYFASAGSSLLLASLVVGTARRIGALVSTSAPRMVLVMLTMIVVSASTLALRRAEAFAYYFSGRASAAQGANQESFDHFKRAVAVDASLVPEDGYERLAVAGFLFGESSRDELKAARRHYRQSPTLEVYLGINDLLREDPRFWKRGEMRIYRALDSATSRRPHLQRHAAVAINHLGLHFRAKGEHGRAADLHRRALALRPRYTKALLGLNRALEAQGNFADAIRACRAAIHIQPRSAGTHHELGKVLARSGNRAEAIMELEKAVALDDGREWSWFMLSQVHRLSGDYRSARGTISRALELDSSQDKFWTEYFNVGIDYHREGGYADAFAIYQEVAAAKPEYGMVHHNLGVLHYGRERFEEAVAAFNRTIELEPDNDGAHLLLAQAYEKSGRTNEAIRAYKRTLALNPDSLQAKDNLLALL
jgi:tetratricopeptide (TPR) repeat protein